MQVICNREKECTIKGCDGHHPHSNCPQKPCARAGGISGAVCVPVQSDFERGQEELRKIALREKDLWGIYNSLTFLGFHVFSSNPAEMPEVCRCGHLKSQHTFQKLLLERASIEICIEGSCNCREFLPAEPLAPFLPRVDPLPAKPDTLKGQLQTIDDAIDEARQEGRKEVVEWFLIRFNIVNDWGTARPIGNVSWSDLQAKKREWGL